MILSYGDLGIARVDSSLIQKISDLIEDLKHNSMLSLPRIEDYAKALRNRVPEGSASLSSDVGVERDPFGAAKMPSTVWLGDCEHRPVEAAMQARNNMMHIL